MGTRVIVPPSPLLTPADILGSHGADDARVKMLIAAAQEEIDGPDGWLGRSIGPQTLETTAVSFDCTVMRLPCPPLIDVVAISYRDTSDVWQIVDADIYEVREDGVWLKRGKSWPATFDWQGAVKVRYQAGYNGISPEEPNGTGPVPERVKLALKLTVQHTLAVGVENLFLRSEEVEGIGTTTYTISTAASDLIKNATDRFLGGLRLFA